MPDKILKVGVSIIPPMVEKVKDKYSGFEIELWEKIAHELNLEFEYKDYTVKNLLNAIKNKKIDIAIAGLTRTEKREKQFDFSHYTLNSGLSILITKKSKVSTFNFIKSLLENNAVKIFYILTFLLFIILLIGNMIWFIEKGSGAFNSNYLIGVFEAFWWVIVTLSAVGYGDIVPLTATGKFIATFVIFFGLTIFGIYIAEVSSIFTLTKIKYKIDSYKDLEGKKVATKENTVAADELNKINALVITVPEIEQAYELLKKNKTEAVVFDTPVIANYIKTHPDDNVIMTDKEFASSTYGFGISVNNQKLKERINQIILKLYDSGEYKALYNRWFKI